MNKVFIIGNLTKDPELIQTTNGTSVCRFTVAVGRKYTNAEGNRETDFLNVVAWRNLADICGKYLRKGSKAAISGNIQTRSYDATDGTKRYVTEIVAEDVEFVGAKMNGSEEEKEVSKLEPISNDGADDGLPF